MNAKLFQKQMEVSSLGEKKKKNHSNFVMLNITILGGSLLSYLKSFAI